MDNRYFNSTVSFFFVLLVVGVWFSATVRQHVEARSIPFQAPTISSFVIDGTSVTGGTSVSAVITLSAPQPAAYVLKFASSNPNAARVLTATGTIAYTITVPAGSASVKFAISTLPVATATSVLFTAAGSGTEQNAKLVVMPPNVSSVVFSDKGVPGGATLSAQITLDGVAPTGGLSVPVQVSGSSATAPASVVVPADQKAVKFSLGTTPVATDTTISVLCGSRENGKIGSFVVRAPTVLAVTINPIQVQGGANVTITIGLDGNAPVGGLTVPLLSSAPSAVVPPNVTFAQGQKTQTVTITTLVPASDSLVTITAGSRTASLSIAAPPLPILDGIGLPFKNSGLTITGPRTTTGRVYLDRVAPAAGVNVSLSTDGGSLIALAPSVTVPAGQTTADFQLTNETVLADTVVHVTASFNGINKTVTLQIHPTALPTPVSLSLSTNSIMSGQSLQATITFDRPSPAGGMTLYVGATPAGAVQFQNFNQQVPGNVSSISFSILGSPVNAATNIILQAQTGIDYVQANLTVNPVPGTVESFTAPATFLEAGQEMFATVTLDVTAPVSRVVQITRDPIGGAAIVGSVTIPANQRQATVRIPSNNLSTAPVNLTVTATFNSTSRSFSVQLNQPSTLANMVLSNSQPLAGSQITATLTLENPAPGPNGANVTVNNLSGSLLQGMPTSVNVPANQTSATFAFTVGSPPPNLQTVNATLSAALNRTMQQTFTISALPYLNDFQKMNGVLRFGQTLNFKVVTLYPAPPGGVVVALSSNQPSILPFPANVTIPGGTTEQVFTATINPSTQRTLANTTVTATVGSVTRNINLAIMPVDPVLKTISLPVRSQIYPGDGVVVFYQFDFWDSNVSQVPVQVTTSRPQSFDAQFPQVLSGPSGNFELHATNFDQAQPVDISITHLDITKSITGQFVFPTLSRVEFPFPEVTQNTSFNLQVYLNYPAQSVNSFSGRFTFTSDHPELMVLPQPTDYSLGGSPPGERLMNIPVVSRGVTSPTTATVTVIYQGVSKTASVIVKP